MTRLVSACVALSLLAVPALAQLSQEHAGWADGPAGFLLTMEERAAWQAVASDEQAERFIELFWVRRDPDLETRANEFKVDFEQRVAAADLQFAVGSTRGALTDRGRVLILMGVPDTPWNSKLGDYLGDLYREAPPRADSTTGIVEMHGLRFNLYKGKALIWEYGRDRVPPSVELGKKVEKVAFAFFDVDGEGDYRLATNIRHSQLASEVLAAVPASHFLHPELDEVPAFPLIAGTVAASAEQLAWLDVDSATWPEAAQAFVTQGVAMAHAFPAWVFLRLPAGAPAADTLVGRLTLADGSLAGTFQKSANGLETAQGTIYEVMVPAPSGISTLEVALAAGSRVLAARSLEVQIEEVASDATYLSPFFAGAQIIEQRDFSAGTPFVFGGYHLVVQPDGAYTKDESLNYFCLVVRPGLGEGGQPDAMVRLRLKHKGRPISTAPARRAELSPVAPDVFMYGAPLPLGFLPAGADYVLELTLEDKVSGIERTTELPFHLAEQPPVAAGATE